MHDSIAIERPGIALVDHLEALTAHAADVSVAKHPTAAERVHETRKLLKRARAYVRLLPEPAQRAQDEALRRIHKDLGGARDIEATREAIERLREDERANARLRRALDRVARALPRSNADASIAVLIEASGALRAAARPRDEVTGFSAIAQGLRRIAKRSRRAMHRASESFEAEDFHAWRREIKYHALCLRYVAPLHPKLLDREHSIADDVARMLGEEHDIELVREAAARVALDTSVREDLEAFFSTVQRTSRQLVLDIGMRIHAETPRAFSERIEAYFRVAERRAR